MKVGDRVYHRNLKLQGTVVDPPFMGIDEGVSLLVEFDDGETREVSVHFFGEVMKNNVVVRNELDEEFFLDVASPEVIRTIIAIEMEDRGHSRKEAKRVLTEVFSLSSEDAEFAIECYLYADET